MNNKFKFSVIIPIYNTEKYLNEAIESITNQSIGFKKNIELILVNDGSIDDSEKICLKYKEIYPDNVVYVKQKNSGVSTARNNGIKKATGDFICFLDSDDKLSKNTFKQIYNAYLKNKNVSLFSYKMKFFDSKKGDHPLNYKYKKNKVVNVLKEYNYPQLSASSVVFKGSILKEYQFDKNIKYSEDFKLVNEILFEHHNIMMLSKPTYYYRKREEENSAIQTQVVNNDWYNITPKKVYKFLFDLSIKKHNKVLNFIQYAVLYDLKWRINCFSYENLDENEKEKYKDIVKYLIKNIDYEVIKNHLTLLPKDKEFFYRLKKIDIEKITAKEIFDYNIFTIDNTYFRKNNMYIFGKLDLNYINVKKFNIYVNSRKVNYELYDVVDSFNQKTFLDTKLYNYKGFKIKINLENINKIEFKYNKEYIYPLFLKNTSFSDKLAYSYHKTNSRVITYHNNIFIIKSNSIFTRAKYEFLNWVSLIKKGKFLHLGYRVFLDVASLFLRKKIVLISDRIDKADDNGEHFFRYMVQNHKEYNTYFILSKNSDDFKRMKKYGKVLDNKSLKYKLLFNLSSYIVSAHAEDYIFNLFGRYNWCCRDKAYFKYIFLQHGIIKDDLSPWLNINSKKIDMFVTSSKGEYNSMFDCKYQYDKNIVKLTGLPRYDSLLDKSKKIKQKNQILFSFTWRNSLTSKINSKNGKRLYNDKFKDTEYFKFLNNLLNDKRILKVLKEKNYRIKFLPHPNVMTQLKDFEINEFVDIDHNVNYQKEFCESKLLITDYSSVFFDFGYLFKPVLYCQFDIEEFFKGQIYDKGYFDYEKDGFGAVTTNYEQSVKKIIECIENDCKIDSLYEKRIKKFYEYFDDKNCQRVFDNMISLENDDY